MPDAVVIEAGIDPRKAVRSGEAPHCLEREGGSQPRLTRGVVEISAVMRPQRHLKYEKRLAQPHDEQHRGSAPPPPTRIGRMK